MTLYICQRRSAVESTKRSQAASKPSRWVKRWQDKLVLRQMTENFFLLFVVLALFNLDVIVDLLALFLGDSFPGPERMESCI